MTVAIRAIQRTPLRAGGIVKIIAAVTGLLLTGGCRMPPPPVSSDLSRPWRRDESDAMRALDEREGVVRLPDPTFGLVEGCEDPGSQPIDQMGGEAVSLETVDGVVAEVLRVNPTLEAAEQTWLASMELYPQATAWNDPAFRFMNGPTIFGSTQGQHLWRVQVAQRVPWYGKRGLMGEVADRQADIAYYNWRRAKNQLAGSARVAYGQYVLAERLYELSSQDLQIAELLSAPPKIDLVSTNEQALEQYDAYRLEQLELERKREELEENRQLARERINVMLKRDLSAPLPVPMLPELPSEYPNENAMISRATVNSPELAAAQRAEQQAATRVALAEKDFYPDLDVVGRFDTVANDFWAPDRANIRPQLGIYLPLMVQQNRRWARLRETKYEQRRRNAETRAIASRIKSDIQRSIAQLDRSQQRLATLDRMLASAVRRADTQEMLVSNDPHRQKESLQARRTVIKYQIEQAKEQAALQERFVELAVLTGNILENEFDPVEPAEQPLLNPIPTPPLLSPADDDVLMPMDTFNAPVPPSLID
ncbi:MAG: TolC family protein [Planctomycetaceae bacterium]|nr:MAG: TolC family protein [Planctomycetaceae bacterium]